MIEMLSHAATVMSGLLDGSDQPFKAPRTDSREVEPADLFFAMRGEVMDGHRFVEGVLAKGAAAVVVDHDMSAEVPTAKGRQIIVTDTRLALGLLGAAVRREWGGPLVAVTGNSGKTTVKEMIKSILDRVVSPEHDALATLGNLNSYVGVPFTLCRLRAQHESGVVELGASHVGELAWTAPLVKPQVAVITNVTGAHVGEFGGMARIAQAKAEILSGLAPMGVAVLNRDDRFYSLWRRIAMLRLESNQIIDFGMDEAAQVHARDVSHDQHGCYRFTLVIAGESCGEVRLPLMGEYNLRNALAAAAAAHGLGVDPADIVAGLARVTHVTGRMALTPGRDGRILLDDTYNANPGAFHEALKVLALQPAPRWCLLGAMGELGEDSARWHAEIGQQARALGIDGLIAFGEQARPAAEAFGGECHEDWAAFSKAIDQQVPKNASVLVKGSRSTHMERAVAHLAASEDDTRIEQNRNCE